ncbi:MAG: thioredoxin domain-containing protein [Anaerolineales bacterium]
MSPKRRNVDSDVLNFQIRREHFFMLVVPITFLLGLAVGYLVWGAKGAATPAPNTTLLENTPAAANQEGAAEESSGTDDIASQLESLPRYEVPILADDPALGAEDAPITIVEFADFECPFCQRHAQDTHARLLEEYGDQIRFVYKDFPLTSLHPNAYPAALAGQCAHEQDKFWDFHDLLFSGRLGLGDEAYLAYAEELGLDIEAFTACLEDQRYVESVQADYDFGIEIGVSSTPTFFVNGIAVIGAQPFDLFKQIIDFELGQPAN